ncbi:MAG: phosphatase PAP2 family protein [Devosia sp.]|nr:phosphatase PAP2 family protein [Devosia sp.]
MFDLSKPWPLGLNGQNWGRYAAGFVLALVAVGFFDHSLSVMANSQSRDVLGFFAEVTRWGESDWLLYPSATLLALSAAAIWVVRGRMLKLALIEVLEVFAFIFVGIGLPGLVANILKRVIGRGRPELFGSVGTLGFHPFANSYVYESFPSGHTTTAFATAAVLGFLAPRWYGLGLVYAVAVGASRLVLGVHYPTDVLTGVVMGTLGAYAVRNAFAARGLGFRIKPDGRIVQRPAMAARRLLRQPQARAAR